MRKQSTGIVLFAILLLSAFGIAPAQAQQLGGGWSTPYRLSSDAGSASEAFLATDAYGFVHCFWTEALFADQRVVIKYARFDGATWTKPNDIYVSDRGIRNVSPFVDQHGVLHIAWAQGLAGPAYYTYAPANDALSAQNWAKPIQIKIPARLVYLQVDSTGVFHMLYIDQTAQAGVYYVRSEDRGITWSDPVWLDPDIPRGDMPDSLTFQLDGNGGLHAAWVYGAREVGGTPDWVRYVHSLDGGHTWSEPLTIDRHVEGSDHDLTSAGPVMAVQGRNVHIIWAAGNQPYRNHRFSTDGGLTWSTPVHIFGDLQGQAGDGLAVDGAGRVHFFGQIRYPMGIYHAYWSQGRWSDPSLVYLIAEENSPDGIGDRIHAHVTLPVIRAGNQVVLTFTDGPADPHRRLFVMTSTLDDVLPLVGVPTPVLSAKPRPLAGPAPTQSASLPDPTATASALVSGEGEPLAHVPAPDLPIRMALIPTLLVLAGVMIMQQRKRMH